MLQVIERHRRVRVAVLVLGLVLPIAGAANVVLYRHWHWSLKLVGLAFCAWIFVGMLGDVRGARRS